MTFHERVIHETLKQVGIPYIWTGKGDSVWDATKGLVRTQTMGFDCSGLQTWGLWKAGGPDWRASQSAQTLYDSQPKASVVQQASKPHYRYYGADIKSIHHIALAVCCLESVILVVEAAGGGRDTVVPTLNAKVFIHYETRKDFVGATLIPVF